MRRDRVEVRGVTVHLYADRRRTVDPALVLNLPHVALVRAHDELVRHLPRPSLRRILRPAVDGPERRRGFVLVRRRNLKRVRPGGFPARPELPEQHRASPLHRRLPRAVRLGPTHDGDRPVGELPRVHPTVGAAREHRRAIRSHRHRANTPVRRRAVVQVHPRAGFVRADDSLRHRHGPTRDGVVDGVAPRAVVAAVRHGPNAERSGWKTRDDHVASDVHRRDDVLAADGDLRALRAALADAGGFGGGGGGGGERPSRSGGRPRRGPRAVRTRRSELGQRGHGLGERGIGFRRGDAGGAGGGSGPGGRLGRRRERCGGGDFTLARVRIARVPLRAIRDS
mmetsp:Transcript_6837/g.28346  ORF Transcript_6837/g.28346 Transcript_6837/m.28346 type:complete len:339 (-) Transcript_6837:216-1232(-)